MKLLLLALLTCKSLADLPINCKVDTLWGDWTFQIGLQGNADDVTNGANYTNLGDVTGTHHFTFSPDSLVKNKDTGSTGTFTYIYNQGLSWRIDQQEWFANFEFQGIWPRNFSCVRTSVGFVHDNIGHGWGRIKGSKDGENDDIGTVKFDYPDRWENLLFDRKFVKNEKFINSVNKESLGYWTSKHYKMHEKYTLRDMNRRYGSSQPLDIPEPVTSLEERFSTAKQVHKKIFSQLDTSIPENLDWRNVNGVSFVSPVDDQGNCGSCYSFGALGQLEGRIRVVTNNTQQPIFSEQEVITCGGYKTYNQGCNGGFPYLIAGKYAEDFGVVEESCAPYNPSDTSCPDTSSCNRWYANNYNYVGGYYGATIGDGGKGMVEELQNGPISVGFNVEGDFSSYSGGVYGATTLKDDFNPFYRINHAVLCVGYGVCASGNVECGDAPVGTPYWIVKNSWGSDWGLGGYFLIVRGVNEVGIETVPMYTSVIPSI